MQLIIDTTANTLTHKRSNGSEEHYPLTSAEAFALASSAWLRCGWDVKHVYTFTWMGRPIIQLPEDIVRLQEVIYTLKPDVIVETGIAHGGSLIFYASLCKAMGKGRVVGVDIDIRPHNRAAIEAHELFPYLTLLEGSSTDPAIVNHIASLIAPHETTLILLDSNHSKEHVLRELELYSKFVSVGSYIVATDGIMAHLVGAPRSQPDWGENNPQEAAREFARTHPEFIIEQPAWLFNESLLSEQQVITYWPSAWLKRLR